MECAAIQDVLVVGKALDNAESQSRKNELDRMAAMLSRLGGRGYQVADMPLQIMATYGSPGADGDTGVDTDSDFDGDFDLEKRVSQPEGPGDSQ